MAKESDTMIIETIVSILLFMGLGLFFLPFVYLFFAVLFWKPQKKDEDETVTFVDEDEKPIETEDEDFEAELDYDIVDLG